MHGFNYHLLALNWIFYSHRNLKKKKKKLFSAIKIYKKKKTRMRKWSELTGISREAHASGWHRALRRSRAQECSAGHRGSAYSGGPWCPPAKNAAVHRRNVESPSSTKPCHLSLSLSQTHCLWHYKKLRQTMCFALNVGKITVLRNYPCLM